MLFDDGVRIVVIGRIGLIGRIGRIGRIRNIGLCIYTKKDMGL